MRSAPSCARSPATSARSTSSCPDSPPAPTAASRSRCPSPRPPHAAGHSPRAAQQRHPAQGAYQAQAVSGRSRRSVISTPHGRPAGDLQPPPRPAGRHRSSYVTGVIGIRADPVAACVRASRMPMPCSPRHRAGVRGRDDPAGTCGRIVTRQGAADAGRQRILLAWSPGGLGGPRSLGIANDRPWVGLLSISLNALRLPSHRPFRAGAV